ncbi:MAG: hypothetical protein NTX49_10355, partial [Chlamydiae bacterium]|nr:hypothetical protein [Chlamydiota bacterium]
LSAKDLKDPHIKTESLTAICLVAHSHAILDTLSSFLLFTVHSLNSGAKDDLYLMLYALYEKVDSNEFRSALIQSVSANDKDSFFLLAKIYRLTSADELQSLLLQRMRTIVGNMPNPVTKIHLLKELFPLPIPEATKHEILQEMKSIIRSQPTLFGRGVKQLVVLFNLADTEDSQAAFLEEMLKIAREETDSLSKVRVYLDIYKLEISDASKAQIRLEVATRFKEEPRYADMFEKQGSKESKRRSYDSD